MARVAALAALCASACFSKPPFSGPGGTGDGGTQDGNARDGQHDDAPDAPFDAPPDAPPDAPACASIYRDDFSQTTNLQDPCKPWGYPEGVISAVSRDMGGLKLQGAAATGWSAGCISDEFNITAGVSIRLVQAQVDGMTSQRFALNPMGTAGTAIAIMNNGGGPKLYLMNNEGTMTPNAPAYNAQTMKWFKLQMTGTAIVATYSTDGVSWMAIGTDEYFQTLPSLGRVEMTGGRQNGGPEYVLWDDFNILTCPP